MLSKKIGDLMYTDAAGASEMLGCSIPAVYRLVRSEKAAEKKARESRHHFVSTGIPFYQADKNTTLFFPIDGLREFVRMRTRGCAFTPAEA